MTDSIPKQMNGLFTTYRGTPVSKQGSTECGAFGWRPRCLQGCSDLRVFTVAISIWSFVMSMHINYFTAVLTQIEKAFGLSSSVIGLIKNIDNIGYVVAVVFVSQICRNANKPVLFAFASFLNAFAVSMFALPHFVYGSKPFYLINVENATDYTGNESDTLQNLCLSEIHGAGDKYNCDDSVNRSNMYANSAAAIFFISCLLQGVAGSPRFSMSLTYLDDNDSEKSPLYFAFVLSTKAFGMLIGFILGAITNKIYVDLTDPGFGTDDHRFVGAWWLGFIICAALNLMMIIPISLFPSNIQKSSPNKQKINGSLYASEAHSKTGLIASNYKEISNTLVDDDNLGDYGAKLKDMPAAVCRLLSDPIYLILLLGTGVEVYMFGFTAFLPKYLSLQFGISASMASILVGVSTAISFCIGPILSGIITTKVDVSVNGALKIIVCVGVVGSLGMFILMMLSCREEWAGVSGLNNVNLNDTCNSGCHCDATDFHPVCGSDGVNYFSACHAGCTEMVDKDSVQTYSHCSCINNGLATQGVCEKSCSSLYSYVAIMWLVKFVSSMDLVPKMKVILRNSDSRDKAMSVALFTAILMFFGCPSPFVFGSVIDSTCITNITACGHKGACLLYDMKAFRFGTHGLAVGLKVLATAIYTLAYAVNHWRSKCQELKDESQNKQISEDGPCINGQNNHKDIATVDTDDTSALNGGRIWKLLQANGHAVNETVV